MFSGWSRFHVHACIEKSSKCVTLDNMSVAFMQVVQNAPNVHE